MEVILLFFTSCFMSLTIVGSYYLGYTQGIKKGENVEGVHFNKNNKDFLVELARWANYNGKEND